MQETTFAELETMFLALGDRTRLRLLALMADGPVAVGFLAERLRESQPKVSRHLAYLRHAGMVTTSRDGKWVYYGIRYPQYGAQRRILESLISSIAVMRVNEADVFLIESNPAVDQEDKIYDETYMTNIADDSSENEEVYYVDRAADDDDIDVFLL